MATTIIAFPVAQRQRSAGNPFISAGWTVPANVTQLRIQLNIPTAAYETAGNSCTLSYDVFKDGAWTSTGGGFTWTSTGAQYIGRGGVVNPPPTDYFPAVEYRGQQIRLRAVIPVSMQIGGDIVTVP